jgi:hypothetical protein
LQGGQEEADLVAFQKYLKKKKIPSLAISSATGGGLNELKWKLWEAVTRAPEAAKAKKIFSP